MSSQQPHHSQPSQHPLSNSSHPLSAHQSQPLFQPIYPPTLQTLDLMQQHKLQELGEFLQKRIYRKLIDKITDNLIKALKRHKIMTESDQFYEEEFVEELNENIKSSVDKLDVWISYNILKRPEVLEFKKTIISREERKLAKCKEITDLLAKIAQKHKEKKAQEVIDQFAQIRRNTHSKIPSNEQIDLYREKINKAKNRRQDPSQIQLQKVAQRIKEYKIIAQNEAGFNLDRLDSMTLE